MRASARGVAAFSTTGQLLARTHTTTTARRNHQRVCCCCCYSLCLFSHFIFPPHIRAHTRARAQYQAKPPPPQAAVLCERPCVLFNYSFLTNTQRQQQRRRPVLRVQLGKFTSQLRQRRLAPVYSTLSVSVCVCDQQKGKRSSGGGNQTVHITFYKFKRRRRRRVVERSLFLVKPTQDHIKFVVKTELNKCNVSSGKNNFVKMYGTFTVF